VLLSLALLASPTFVGSTANSASVSPKPVKHGYVFNKILLPNTNTQAQEYGFDLNSDAEADNQLGKVFATLGSMGLDLQSQAQQVVSSGELVTLLSVQTTSLKNAKRVRVRLFKGNPQTSPDLNGGGRFSVDKTSAHAELKARIVSKVIVSKAGDVPFALPGFLPGMAPVPLVLLDGLISAKCTAKRCTDGRIGGGVSAQQIDLLFIPAMGKSVRPLIARDCIGTTEDTCAEGSTGRALMGLFDANDDGTVTDQEIRENALIGSLLAPDLDLDGNGVADSLSAGFGFVAANAKIRGD
jgi:hypothetical protein